MPKSTWQAIVHAIGAAAKLRPGVCGPAQRQLAQDGDFVTGEVVCLLQTVLRN